MSLTKEKVTKNAKKYFATGEKYGFMTEDLMNLLGAEFIAAPASTNTDLNNAFEGGLIAHLLNVAKFAVALKTVVPNGDKVELGSLIKVCLLHQIGKSNLFIAKDPKTSKWHIDRGILYDYNENITSFRVGERSIFYAITSGVTLTEDEYQAILNHDKEDDKQAKWHSNTLGVILRMANELAIIEEKAK